MTTMPASIDNAVAMFAQGYNCAQSVLACCGSQFGISRDLAIRLGQAFGGGMCHLGQTCGAVTGAMMVIGLRHSKADQGEQGKQAAMRLAQEFARRFKARNGSINCNELLGCDPATPEGMRRCREEDLFKTLCARLVRDAAEIVEELLKGE
jgi:C_GCAxxG_C_C family probable redox protein